MTNNKKILELTGKITAKKPDKVKDKKSPHYLTPYYRLAVAIEDNPEIKEILAFECWLENKQEWNKIEQLEFKELANKNCYFKVQKKPGAGQVYRLINWEILPDIPVGQILKNHGSK